VVIVKHELSEKEKKARSMVCLPLDGLNLEQANELIKELSGYVGWFKYNDQFISAGPLALDFAFDEDVDVFLDLKYNDIPNTVKNHSYNTTRLGVQMFNVHASAGMEAMKAAVEGREKALVDLKQQEGIDDAERPKIYAVTVLTSLDIARLLDTYKPLLGEELNGIDFGRYYPVSKLEKKKPEELSDNEKQLINEWNVIVDEYGIKELINHQVLHMAQMAQKAGLDGIVCSAAELAYVKPKMPEGFLYTTPGIELPKTGEAGADQIRTFTPANAVKAGSTILVIGRAITGGKTPEERQDRAYSVLQDMASVL
jgi:orotidine-5'-phosphate decarboxylase